MLSFSPNVRESLLKYEGKIAITGGRGWVGQATLEMLEGVFGDDIEARTHVFGSGNNQIVLRSGRAISCAPIEELHTLPDESFLLAHFAFVTKEKAKLSNIKEYIAVNRQITGEVQKFSERESVEGLFCLSSGAVYSKTGGNDVNSFDNPYGFLKLEEETRLSPHFASSRKAIIRLFNLAGPYINKIDDYALGSFLQNLKQGRDIQIGARHPVVRSYVHVRDVVDLGFAIMTKAIEGPNRPFDTAGEVEIELSDLAGEIFLALGISNGNTVRPEFDRSLPVDHYVGDGSTFRNLAAAVGFTPDLLDSQIRDTAEYIWSLGG